MCNKCITLSVEAVKHWRLIIWTLFDLAVGVTNGLAVVVKLGPVAGVYPVTGHSTLHARAVGRTDPPTPALPYIAAKGADADACFDAVQAAIAGLSQDDRDTLLLRGLVRIAAQDYLAVPTPPTPDQIAHKI